MSHVADVIITLSVTEETDEGAPIPGIQEINRYLSSKGKGELEKVDGYAGGRKALQAEVWMGAFNYLEIPEFVATVAAQHWQDRDAVQVFIKDEHEDVFSQRII